MPADIMCALGPRSYHFILPMFTITRVPLQGLVFLPLWPHQAPRTTPTTAAWCGMLLQLGYDGDVAVKPLSRGPTNTALLRPPAAVAAEERTRGHAHTLGVEGVAGSGGEAVAVVQPLQGAQAASKVLTLCS